MLTRRKLSKLRSHLFLSSKDLYKTFLKNK
jgi:hypothetical protein